MGTIVLSLSPSSSPPYTGIPSTDLATSTQVKIISVANTFSRLLAGPLADYISPIVSYLPVDDTWYARKHRVSRISFLSGTAILLAVTFFWTATQVRSQGTLWIMRYTYSPSIVFFLSTFDRIVSARAWFMAPPLPFCE